VYSQKTLQQVHCNNVNCNDVCVLNITLPCGQCIPCNPIASAMCLSAIVQCNQPTNETVQESLFQVPNCQGTPYRVIQPDLINPSATFCYAWGDFWLHNICPTTEDMENEPKFFSWLDLSRFVPKLLKEEAESIPTAPIAWSAIVEYKRFLALKQKFPTTEIAPSPIIDKVWHMHILDTKQYMKDCNLIFGEYMHHYPSFDPDEDEQIVMMDRYHRTLELYQQVFGFPATELIWSRIPSGEQLIIAECFLPACCSM